MFNSFIAAEPGRRSAAGLAAGLHPQNDGGEATSERIQVAVPRLTRQVNEPGLFPVMIKPQADESKRVFLDIVWDLLKPGDFWTLSEFRRWYDEKVFPVIVEKFRGEDATLLAIAIAFDRGGTDDFVKNFFYEWVRENFTKPPPGLTSYLSSV